MAGESKISGDLERLKRRIRAGQKNLDETAKKTKNLNAKIQAEIRTANMRRTGGKI